MTAKTFFAKCYITSFCIRKMYQIIFYEKLFFCFWNLENFSFAKQGETAETRRISFCFASFSCFAKTKILTKMTILISRILIFVFILKHWLLYYTRIEMNRSYLKNFTKIKICVYFETLAAVYTKIEMHRVII